MHKQALVVAELSKRGERKLARKVLLLAKKWSKEPTKQARWHPPEGFFNGSQSDIAKGLKGASKDYAQAVRRLTFYINRAGSNLSAKERKRLENVRPQLKALYGK